MDKDHERDKKQQQQQQQQSDRDRQEILACSADQAVNEHFEESLRRAKEKQQQQQQQQQQAQQRTSWSINTLQTPAQHHSLNVHPSRLTHPLMTLPPGVLGGSGPPPSSLLSVAATQSSMGLGKSSSPLTSQQLYDAQRKQALGIPSNYRDSRASQQQRDYEQEQRSRAAAAANDRIGVFYAPQQWPASAAAAHKQLVEEQIAADFEVRRSLTQQQQHAAAVVAKSLAKLKNDPAALAASMSAYSFSASYPKSQVKGDVYLPNPPPLMSDMQHTPVIVKHDTKSGGGNAGGGSHKQSGHTTTLHQPYSNIGLSPTTSASHHSSTSSYDSYTTTMVSTSSLNNSDRFGGGSGSGGRSSAHSSSSSSPHAHSPSAAATYSLSKPKVSSPAPSHIYGKPSADNVVLAGLSAVHARPPEPIAPKPLFQPFGLAAPPVNPPPAHSSRSASAIDPSKSPYSVPPTIKPPPMHGLPMPSLASSPLPPPLESHTSGPSPLGAHMLVDPKVFSTSPKLGGGSAGGGSSGGSASPVQTQPLDLGSKRSDETTAPRRKTSTPFPISAMIEPKKPKMEPSAEAQITVNSFSMPLAPSPVAATTPAIAASTSPKNNLVVEEPPAVVPVAAAKEVKMEVVETKVAAPTTPSTKTANNSASAAPVRHLKKAWLQRHTGEDNDDTTGLVGSGNCIKLPLKLEQTSGGAPTATKNGKEEVKEESNSSTTENKLVQMKKGSNSVVQANNDKEETAETDSSSTKDPPTPIKDPLNTSTATSVTTAASDMESESEKNSDTDKESVVSGKSDSTPSAKKVNNGTRNSHNNKPPGKRGRRPKQVKEDNNAKKQKQKNDNDPFCKPPISQLKKTGEPFLQDGACFEVAPKLAKCRECRWTPNQRSKSTSNIFCRFYAFRKLRYNKNGQLAISGFSDPLHDPREDDLKLWMPDADNPPPDLDLQISRFLLAQVADQFCDLLQQEREAIKEHMSDDKTVAWKRVVQGVREMCDVCETTLFNYHWVCEKCGFVVCIDCYKSRKQGLVKVWTEVSKDRDDFLWLFCTNRSPHDQDRLMLTQIIAGDSLEVLGRQVHEMRALWDIPQYCACPASRESPPKATKGVCKEYINKLLKNELNKAKAEAKNNAAAAAAAAAPIKTEKDGSSEENSQASPLSWLADVAIKTESGLNGFEAGAAGGAGSTEDAAKEVEDDDGHSALRDLLTRPSNKNKDTPTTIKKPPKKAKLESLDVTIKSVIGKLKKGDEEVDITNKSVELKHFIGKNRKKRSYFPIRIMTLVESNLLYPSVPHQWLCEGKLLRLLDPANVDNFKIFQEQWKRGQPVICSDVSKRLDMTLWAPESFSRDFGEDKNDLINCMSGNIVPNQQMKKFWDGFDHITRRLKDDEGKPMLLKLKDWPPGEDFAEILPTRFTDLMKALPLGDYTQRSGKLNLASRLPDCFVRPDLGPKMYNAYGSALYPTKGTTNLHLDISDAVNVMVYVGIPRDGNADEHIKEAYRAIDEAGCDVLTRRRVREKNELPGALWHIYAARDADKIRDLLNKVAIERGERLEPHHDPIHDQSWYLDGPLRERLYEEYGVEGYPIVQCIGDAVFVPAGAPHQVRNLHNCIKVAEDFVSPENIAHCFHLTQEFRELSDTHSNHEDKLQIKNIIYHAIKDSIACLSHLVSNEISESQSSELLASRGGASSLAASPVKAEPAAGAAIDVKKE